MYNKMELSSRERKNMKSKKMNDTTGKYSTKHIRQKEELMEWKKKNNSSKGSKSRHLK